jgi:dipeptidyl aminopeptidase/acylaminoacyl peptidase
MLREVSLANDAPWKQRFRAQTILGTQIARAAPQRGLVTSNRSGVYQLCAWEVPSGELRPLTHRPEGVVSGWISPDGRYVYYHHDQRGNELGHVVRVPFEGGAPQDLTPDLPPYPTFGMYISRAGNMVAFPLADATGYHLCCLLLGVEGVLAAPRLFAQGKHPAICQGLSYGGDIAVMASTERTGTLRGSLVALDTASGEGIGTLWDGPESSLAALGFAPVAHDLRLLARTNRTGLTRPLLWNPWTGERIDLAPDELEGEVYPGGWSSEGTRLLLRQFNRAVAQLYVYDLEHRTLTRLQHPRGTYARTFFGPQGEIVAEWQDSTHPVRLIALDGETGVQTRTILATDAVSGGHPWQSITFTSSDGQAIQGWLGLPDGKGPFPAILHMHGGPEDVMTDRFSPGAQAWLDHGFAFLTINYRGSVTFGRAFLEQIWGNLGHWEVEDMVAARAWLIERGIARPNQIFLTGWSYGGYLTLQALGTHPQLWAGGMAGIAVADWAIAHEDTTETLRGIRALRFGGTPQEVPERYAASSPITYAERVTAPVLIIQGRHDTRTPPRSVELYEAKMKALGKSIEVHWFGAGHGSLAVEQQIEHQERMLRFADRVLS